MENRGAETRYVMRDEVLATWITGALVLGTVAPSLGSFGDSKLGFLYIVMAVILQLWAMYSFYVDATYSNHVLLVILTILLFVYVYSINFLGGPAV